MVNHGPAVRNEAENSENSIKARFGADLPYNIGPCDDPCSYCGALHWRLERQRGTFTAETAVYAACCQEGAVKLPSTTHKNELTPEFLKRLLCDQDRASKNFRQEIRRYNNALSFASTGTKQDVSVAGNGGSWTYKIVGRLTHKIGSLLPTPGLPRKFAQIFMYGDQGDDEATNRNTRAGGGLEPTILKVFQNFLYRHNPFAKLYKSAEQVLDGADVKTIKIKSMALNGRDPNRYNFPTCNKVVAVIEGDGNIGSTDRDIILRRHDGPLRRICELNTNYFSLRYPIFFMFGSHGWDEHYRHMNNKRESGKVSNLEWAAYTLFTRTGVFSPILRGGRLLQEYIVDMYVCVENTRMKYFKMNQRRIRAELYKGATEALTNNDMTVGKRIILPSSFIGGPRAMHELYHDAMALVRAYGPPSFFVTMTANPKWPEITAALLPGQTSDDRPDLVARVFELKLQELHEDLFKRDRLGKNVSYVHTVEFQKRGNPHDHGVMINDVQSAPRTPAAVNLAVSAMLPDPEESPDLFQHVTQYMLHGPCHEGKACWNGFKCKYGYPKEFTPATAITEEAYPSYKRPDDGRFFVKNGYRYTNQDVVPYNSFLLLKFQCHINVEVTLGMKSIKYLYKYISKGHDRSVVSLEVENEPNDFVDGRTLASPEAIWRLYKYSLSGRYPSITRLMLHLPDSQLVYFQDTGTLRNQMDSGQARRTTLTEFFAICNAGGLILKTDIPVRSLLYGDMPVYYWWNKGKKMWERRINNTITVSRLHFAAPSHGERYYLRLLLTTVRGPTSFDNLKTVNGVLHRTFRSAADSLGLLLSDTHFDACLTEAAAWKTGRQLRDMFGLILVHSPPANPIKLWEDHIEDLCDDCEYELALISPTLKPTAAQIYNYGLSLLESCVIGMGKTLDEVGLFDVDLQLLFEIGGGTTDHDDTVGQTPLTIGELDTSIQSLTAQQSEIFQYVCNSIDSDGGQMLFIDGPGGSGKTYLLNTTLNYFHTNNIPFVAVASSGIAALLLLNGGTAHSVMKIPLSPDQTSTCNFTRADGTGRLLACARLIVWDEISMMNKDGIECVDRSMRDLRENDQPFGGATLLFSGDFRQILPVVRMGTLQDSVRACIKNSYLWSSVTQFKLTANMRLRQGNRDDTCEVRNEGFAEWLLQLGDGQLQSETVASIPLKHVKVMPFNVNSAFDKVVVNSFYSEATEMLRRKAWSQMAGFFAARVIITPLNKTVDRINEHVLKELPGRSRHYKSVDAMETDWAEQVSSDILNSFNFSGFPQHDLQLKVGCVVVLLRNLHLRRGLCNGTRLLILALSDNALYCLIITGPKRGVEVFLPRITLQHPGDATVPIAFHRSQFPVTQAFAMTINKSQGQTVERVVLVLPTPVFAHGQLYVGLTRCTSSEHTTVSLAGSDNAMTVNVVSKAVIQ